MTKRLQMVAMLGLFYTGAVLESGPVAAQSPTRADAAPPAIVWASDPVRPDETVLLQGDGFRTNSVIELSRLPDSPVTTPKPEVITDSWRRVEPLQRSEQSLKLVLPKKGLVGAWRCRVHNGDVVSDVVTLNAPDVWWWQGDGGETAAPGGWLRLFGKSLNFGGESRACLRAANRPSVILHASQADGYALRFALPTHVEEGDYELFVHNGLGGDATWRRAGVVAVQARALWKSDVFNVKDFGPKPGEALLAALKKAEANGGGIVFLPRGRYPVADRLVIPPHTVLKGEGIELVSLYWPDLDAPPQELITGADFGIESLSLYCQSHKNVVADTAASQTMFLKRVRIRANCYFMIERAGQEFRGHRGPAELHDCGAAVLLRGKNFEVSDCDIYASYYAIRIIKAKAGVIARNRLLYGGRGYSIENTDRLIFEDNLVSGNNLLAIGNDFTTFYGNYCRHIYFAKNRLQQMFGADREMMTLDAGGGAYFGKIASAVGATLTLAGDPVFRDYAPKPHTNWVGAAVMVLDGRGAGQYRFVTANQGRQWEVDRPWTVLPDETSRISIAPFRGQNLFIGNTFEDGGAFQLYGAAHDTIVAGNKGSRMDGFLVWGLNPHGWGHQPSWYCQFLDNEIVEGNGYGHRTASFGTITGEESKTYDGPMVRGVIFRRNQCDNNGCFRIRGTVADALVEHCRVQHADCGIQVQATTRGVVLRENTFEDVTRSLEGDGVGEAVIVPKP